LCVPEQKSDWSVLQPAAVTVTAVMETTEATGLGSVQGLWCGRESRSWCVVLPIPVSTHQPERKSDRNLHWEHKTDCNWRGCERGDSYKLRRDGVRLDN
jgi:hypothetical protein